MRRKLPSHDFSKTIGNFFDRSIDPTSLTSGQQRYLLEFLAVWPHKHIFLKGVSYSQPAPNRGLRKSSKQNKLVLTHTIQRCESMGDSCYEILGKEYEDSDYIHRYEVIGHLYIGSNVAYFSKSQPHFSLKFKGRVDVTRMNEAQSRLLGAALLKIYYCQRAEKIRYFPSEMKTYCMTDAMNNPVQIQLDLVYPLIARQRDKVDGELRFEVVGKALGEGAFAQVARVIMTLLPQSDGSLTRKFTNRVIKKERHSLQSAPLFGQGEYPLARLTPHLHAKSPVFATNGDEVLSFLTLKHLPGATLVDLLNAEVTKNQLTMSQRLRLILNLISGLDEQIHQRKIVHRDIKPANILVDLELCNYPIVSYLDLGLSKHSSVIDHGTRCGTPLYVSPEILSGWSSTSATDVYSLALVIWEIFHVRLKNEIYLPRKNDLIDRLRNKYELSGVLSKSECSTIADIITNMANGEVVCRLSLREAHVAFDHVRLGCERKQLITEVDILNFSIAHDSAVQARRQIQKQFCATLGSVNWGKLKSIIGIALDKFPEEPHFVDEFVFTLRIEVLFGVTTKAEIYQKLSTLAETEIGLSVDIRQSCDHLCEMLSRPSLIDLNADYRKYLEATLKRIQRRFERRPYSFNHICELIKSADTDLSRVKFELNYLKSIEGRWNVGAPVVRPFVLSGGEVGVDNKLSQLYDVCDEGTVSAGKAGNICAISARK